MNGEPPESQFIQPDPGPTPPGDPLAQKVRSVFVSPRGLRPGWRIFLYVAMGAAIFLILAFIFSPIQPKSALWQNLFSQCQLVVASLGSAVIMAKIEKRRFDDYGLPIRCAFSKLFWVGLIWGIVALSALIFIMRGIGVFSFGDVALHGGRILKFAAFWAAFFLLVGLFEEFTFRGYTLFTLAQGWSFWPAAALLSFIFGAVHLNNPGEAWVGALCAGFIGLFFCFTLRRTGNLWFAAGMHASWDWGESYLYSVPDSGGVATGHLLSSSLHGSRWLTGGSVGPEGSVLVFVVMALVWVAFDRMYPQVRYPLPS